MKKKTTTKVKRKLKNTRVNKQRKDGREEGRSEDRRKQGRGGKERRTVIRERDDGRGNTKKIKGGLLKVATAWGNLPLENSKLRNRNWYGSPWLKFTIFIILTNWRSKY